MDKLLQEKPKVLSNERYALYGLMDRFIGSIEAYRKEYETITAQKNSDLKSREDDTRNSLDRLVKQQQNEKNKCIAELEGLINSIEKNITDSQNQAKKNLNAIETKYTDFEKREKNELARLRELEQDVLSSANEVRQDIISILSEIDSNMGQTLMGKSKLQVFRENNPVSGAVAGPEAAVSLLQNVDLDEARSIRDEIADINLTTTRKIIFSGKRKRILINLLETLAKIETSINILENQYIENHKRRQLASSTRCRDFRKSCNNEKEAVINNRDQYVAAQKKKIAEAKDKNQKEMSRMVSEHSKKSDEQKKHFANQLAAARVNWDEKLVNCGIKFVKMMEEEYPADRFNAWIRQFWNHPRNVEDYSKLLTTQMNVLIGVSEINIASWYKGGYSEPIKKVLTKYMWLFGTNKEMATKSYTQGKWILPYLISLDNGDSILFSHDNQSEERVKAIINALGMRLLRSVPACLMRFLLCDADGIGAFGRLMSLDPANSNNPTEPYVKSIAIGEGGKVHSSDISQQIEETKVMMDDLAAQLTSYPSLNEFNANNPLSKQIYRPLLMMNFPSGLNEDDVKKLTAMSTQCNKWGYSMFLAQPDKERDAIKPDHQRYYDELYKNVIYMRLDSSVKSLQVKNPRFLSEKVSRIYLYGLPAQEAMEGIAADIRERSVEVSSVKISFPEAKGVCPDNQEKYSSKSDMGIVIPVGYLEGGKPFRIQLDDKHVHTLIMGNTGSGKTNMLHVMMTNLMLRYAPSEVTMYLIDFKYGLDFRVYTKHNLPNFESISITNDPEFALAMLEHLEAEQSRRSNLMGSRYNKISDYNMDHPNNKLNRIVLIVDELYELVKQAPDDIQKQIVMKIDSFAHQTRAFGIHMIISGQDLDKIDRFETIKSQCTNRLALHCDDEQVRMLMDEAGVVKMHSIDSTDQGACVFSLSGSKNPQIEHTVLLTSKQQDVFLREIHEHYLSMKQITRVKVLLKKVSDNPNHKIQMFVDKGLLPDSGFNKMYVGEPMSLEGELNLIPQHNVWLAGGGISKNSNKAAISFMLHAALSLTMEKLRTGNIDLICTNYNDYQMRSEKDEENDRFGQLTANFPSIYRYDTGEKFLSNLDSLLSELDERKNGYKPKTKAIWWFIARPELNTFANGGSSAVIDFKELLLEGPKYNIHVVMWTSDIKKAGALQLSKNLFADRVCIEMTPEEAKLCNGEDISPMPTEYKAILINQNKTRFSIYELPDGKWMSSLFDRLSKKI